MDAISDFLINDPSGFTCKLLQGAPIRALFSFDEHREKSREEELEALDVIDTIWLLLYYKKLEELKHLSLISHARRVGRHFRFYYF